MHKASIDSRGRISVPVDLRHKLQLKQGDVLTIKIDEGELVFTPLRDQIATVLAEIRAGMTIAHGRSLADELIAERRAEGVIG